MCAKFYNDSKGTKLDVNPRQIRAMNRPRLLIWVEVMTTVLEYDEWIESFDGKVKKLVLIGQTEGKDCGNVRNKHGFEDVILCEEHCRRQFDNLCLRTQRSGDAVLLSCSGHVRSDEERGCIFKEYVRTGIKCQV